MIDSDYRGLKAPVVLGGIKTCVSRSVVAPKLLLCIAQRRELPWAASCEVAAPLAVWQHAEVVVIVEAFLAEEPPVGGWSEVGSAAVEF